MTVEELAAEFGRTHAGEIVYNILAKLEEYERRIQALEGPAASAAPEPSAAHPASESAHEQEVS